MCKKLVVLLLLVGFTAYGQVSPAVRRAPEFPKDVRWLDKEAPVPHRIEDYRGRVLLIDFWEYTCINCIRDFAVVKRWYAKYHPYGFEVIGVHYGEFSIGFKPANVQRAAKEYRLPWPVVADVEGSIWKAYGSDAWPNRYLIGSDGDIVMQIKGEGNNRAMEQKIRDLLAVLHPETKNIALDPDENAFGFDCGIPTQETYVGDWYGRGALENSQGYVDNMEVNFKADHRPSDGGVVLGGRWRTLHDGVTSEAAGGSATLRYHSRSVYAVMSVANPKKPVRVDILQDDKPLSRAEADKDVQFDSKGPYLEVREARMYYLIKNTAFGEHLLTLKPEAAGFTLHSFTYGNNCQQGFAAQ